MTEALRSKTKACSRLIAGSNPAEGMDVHPLCRSRVRVGSGLCDEPITRSGESCWVCNRLVKLSEAF
jgi:hypothetical protein